MFRLYIHKVVPDVYIRDFYIVPNVKFVIMRIIYCTVYLPCIVGVTSGGIRECCSCRLLELYCAQTYELSLGCVFVEKSAPNRCSVREFCTCHYYYEEHWAVLYFVFVGTASFCSLSVNDANARLCEFWEYYCIIF